MDPHPQSQASLLALQENLRREGLSRARALKDLWLKKIIARYPEVVILRWKRGK